MCWPDGAGAAPEPAPLRHFLRGVGSWVTPGSGGPAGDWGTQGSQPPPGWGQGSHQALGCRSAQEWGCRVWDHPPRGGAPAPQAGGDPNIPLGCDGQERSSPPLGLSRARARSSPGISPGTQDPSWNLGSLLEFRIPPCNPGSLLEPRIPIASRAFGKIPAQL